MTNDIDTPKTFEEKLKARIKDSIGDLISDDDLSKLVHRGVEDIFFKPRPNPARTYYNSTSVPETIPPLLHELVKEALQPAVKEVVEKWVHDNRTAMKDTVQEVVSSGVGKAVLVAMSRQFEEPLLRFQSEVYTKLNKTTPL